MALVRGVITWSSPSDKSVAADHKLRSSSRFESEGIDMKKFTEMLFVTLLACASALPLSSVQAWWGGPGWGGPWGYGYHSPWGYQNWSDGLGYLLGDLWGDVDFSVHFSLYGHGDGYGRGYGNYYNHGNYYNYYGHGPYGYPGYRGGYPAYYGAPHGYAIPNVLPVAQQPVVTAGQK
jgi:hypothetical protein